ncbi:MAG: dinuclear metal center YbgI/SA1388 family protein [Cocleimonas sp.]|jgi:dinuclear metal center YbgI/SA1388 family protein
MESILTITNYIDGLLESKSFEDYAPNGLQVQGKTDIRKIITGVSATQALIEAAIEKEADVILVHHGWFWGKEDSRIVGMKYKRLKLLMDHDISLLAYHLPLDAHPELGNNAQLAKRLDIQVEDVMDKQGVGNYGRLPEYISLEKLGENIEKLLARKPMLISGGDHAIRRVAWCTGGAQGWIHKAAEAGVDAYISGEVSEHTVHVAREMGVHYIAAGHHATERYGAMALGEHVAAKFGLQCEFVDIENPA